MKCVQSYIIIYIYRISIFLSMILKLFVMLILHDNIPIVITIHSATLESQYFRILNVSSTTFSVVLGP